MEEEFSPSLLLSFPPLLLSSPSLLSFSSLLLSSPSFSSFPCKMDSIKPTIIKLKETLSSVTIPDSPVFWGVAGAVSATATGLAAIGLYRVFRRFPTVEEIPTSYFEKQRKLKGLALKVNDADGFRLYHTPLFRSGPSEAETSTRGYYGKNTLSIRIAGVDAPELGHFGAKPQPFAAEAKEFLQKLVEGKKVTIQIHQKDQYSRLVCSAWVRRYLFFKKNVSLAMAENGFATVYDRAGGVYGGMKEQFIAAEKEAKRKKLGMWSQDMSSYVSPMDYKQKNKEKGPEE